MIIKVRPNGKSELDLVADSARTILGADQFDPVHAMAGGRALISSILSAPTGPKLCSRSFTAPVFSGDFLLDLFDGIAFSHTEAWVFQDPSRTGLTLLRRTGALELRVFQRGQDHSMQAELSHANPGRMLQYHEFDREVTNLRIELDGIVSRIGKVND